MNKAESKYFNTAVRMDKAFLELLEEKDFAYISVKEICEKAGVNRSTFYLHYETVGDLLSESLEYMHREFTSYFSNQGRLDVGCIETAELKDLYLISPEYLSPFLQFVKDHKKLYRTAMEKTDILGSKTTFNRMFSGIFSPILDRYQVQEEAKPFIMAYYLNGIAGITKVWIETDCQAPMEFVLDLIMTCIKHPAEELA